MNKVILIGRWVKEIDLNYTKNGNAVANCTLAVNRDKQNTDFINVTMLGKVAENTANYSGKGRLVCVEGSLRTEVWEKDNKKNYKKYVLANSVQFLDKPKKEESYGEEVQFNEDELPFA